MDVINIQGTDDTPNVILDKGNNKFELSGRSLNTQEPLEEEEELEGAYAAAAACEIEVVEED